MRRRTRLEDIHSTAFSARLEAVNALRAAGLGSQSDPARLRSVAAGLRASATDYGEAPNGVIYAALADLIDIMGLLVEWRATVLDAGTDAQRFVTAARERVAVWNGKYKEEESLAALQTVAGELAAIQSVSEVATAAVHLAGIPLPIGLYSSPPRKTGREVEADDGEKKPVTLAVAFLKFTINGMPVAETHYVAPGQMHDLDIEVRVSRWPAGATALVLEPISIEHPGTYKLPVFSLPAPMGEGPFRLTQRGRAELVVPQHFNARPFEFKYVAHFVPPSSEQPVDTVGQRTLMLEGVDLACQSLTGYGNLDRKLIVIRDRLRAAPGIEQQELRDALSLAMALANFAGQSVQDNLFKSAISEGEFQKVVRQFLRAQPNIGAELEEHPHAAGGITDLSFKGIPLELKAEPTRTLSLNDCRRYVAQTGSYAVAGGKRLGVLCVLDCSAKKQPPFPVEDGIGVLTGHESNSSVFVITVLVQGNLALPSSFGAKAS